jgi:hypothetical protein
VQLKMRTQKSILLMTGIFKGGRRSADYYAAGLSLIFDLFPTCCQPDLYLRAEGRNIVETMEA